MAWDFGSAARERFAQLFDLLDLLDLEGRKL